MFANILNNVAQASCLCPMEPFAAHVQAGSLCYSVYPFLYFSKASSARCRPALWAMIGSG